MMEKIQKLIEYYVLERKQMTCLFVLIDSRLEPQRIDLEFIEWLGENGIPFALIFTKADKQSVGKTKASVNRFLNTLKEQWEERLAAVSRGPNSVTYGLAGVSRKVSPHPMTNNENRNILNEAIYCPGMNNNDTIP